MRSTVFCLALLSTFYNSEAQSTAQRISEYLRMKGSIGKHPVVFHLYRVNDDVNGYYYYEQYQQPVYLRGKLDGNKIQLHHDNYQEEQKAEHITATLENSTLAGSWTAGSKKLPINIKRWSDSLLKFQYVYVSGKKKIPKTPFTSIDEVTYAGSSVWPTEKSIHPSTTLIKSVIRDEFGKEHSDEEIGKIMLDEKNEILNSNNNDSEIVNYAIENRVQVTYADDRFLSLAHFNYAYTGGAHGNYGTTYTCVNLQLRKKLKLSDIIDTLAAKTALKASLEKAYREQYNIPRNEALSESLFVESIEPNNNFFLTGKCISFNYTPYEIGAYALGEVLLYIPLKDLSNYLKPGIFIEEKKE